MKTKKMKVTGAMSNVIPCNAETANEVWKMIRKDIMNIDPDLVFRSRKTTAPHWKNRIIPTTFRAA